MKQFFQDQPLGGKLLSDWVGNAFSTGARDSILDAIREGVVMGEGYRKLVKRVMTAADTGFSITQREATTLGPNGTFRVPIQAHKKRFTSRMRE